MGNAGTRLIPELTARDIHRVRSNIQQFDDITKCWPWLKSSRRGYGQINIQGSIWRVNRVIYKIHYCFDPMDLSVLHDCDNTICCNPHHLFLGTQQDNMQDLKQKGRLLRLQIDVQEVLSLAGNGITQREIARQLGCSQRTIAKIIHNTDFHRTYS